jgi:hypothetical protein
VTRVCTPNQTLPVRDLTPESVEEDALELVARHGYLAPENLVELEPEERGAIASWVRQFRPDLFKQLECAYEAGDQWAFYSATTSMCLSLNVLFDEETTRNLHTLPEEERERVRTLPVSPETWRQLQARARWHVARPLRRSSAGPRMRHGRSTRHVRRRRVASSPRRARAPGRPGEDGESDDDDVDPLPAGLILDFTAASERLSRHLQRRAAHRRIAW